MHHSLRTSKVPSWKFFRLDRITSWKPFRKQFTAPPDDLYNYTVVYQDPMPDSSVRIGSTDKLTVRLGVIYSGDLNAITSPVELTTSQPEEKTSFIIINNEIGEYENNDETTKTCIPSFDLLPLSGVSFQFDLRRQREYLLT